VILPPLVFLGTGMMYHKFLTKLVLFGIANTSSIMGDTRQVWQWYHHSKVLMVFGQFGIVAILILVIMISSLRGTDGFWSVWYCHNTDTGDNGIIIPRY